MGGGDLDLAVRVLLGYLSGSGGEEAECDREGEDEEGAWGAHCRFLLLLMFELRGD